MYYSDINDRINFINKTLEVKRVDLSLRTKRRAELESRQTANTAAKRKFIARIRLDIKSLIDEINALNTELWGLQEMAKE